MCRTSLSSRVARAGVFALAVGGGTTLGLGVGNSKGASLSAAAGLAQPAPTELRGLLREARGVLTEGQSFRLAKKAIVEGRAYRNAWFAAGHRIDFVSPKYFAVAGKCYAKAVDAVHRRLAQGLAVSRAEQAKAIAYSAWWRFRSEPASDYPKTLSDLWKAAKLSPHHAIYWVMLARVTWWRRSRPCKPQWDLAVKYLRRAIRLDHKCAIAYWMLGQFMVSGPHYDVMKLKTTYNAKGAEHCDRLCYANRRHFNRFFFYYSDAWIRNEILNVKEALGIAPPNTEPPKSGTRKR